MTDQQTKCYYCQGNSKCTNIGLYEGEGGYKKDDTRFRIICGNCYPLINHQGGRSWEIRFKTDDINLQPEFIHKVIKFITDEEEEKEDCYNCEECNWKDNYYGRCCGCGNGYDKDEWRGEKDRFESKYPLVDFDTIIEYFETDGHQHEGNGACFDCCQNHYIFTTRGGC